MFRHILQHRRLLLLSVTVFGILASVVGFGMVAAQDELGFTPTYRSWTRVSNAFISSNLAFDDPELNPAAADLTGFLTVYANDIALEGYLNGKTEPFPVGSIIVAESTAMIPIEGQDVSLEGPVKLTVWMIRDENAPEETGGWRWELWTVQDGEDVNAGLDVPTQVAACVVCHQRMLGGLAAETDLVFSSFSDLDHLEDYLAAISME